MMRLTYVLIGIGVVIAGVIAYLAMAPSSEPVQVVPVAAPPPLEPSEVVEPDGGFRPKPDFKVRLRPK
jgi:hypothetical protein